ncbi:MAG: hypothetical protein IJ538_03575 [Clostridia bacterium]|nr:hypothetical protein [Clostridia bacterium]
METLNKLNKKCDELLNSLNESQDEKLFGMLNAIKKMLSDPESLRFVDIEIMINMILNLGYTYKEAQEILIDLEAELQSL